VLDTELPVEQIVARAEADLAQMSEELAAAAAEYVGTAHGGAGAAPGGAGTALRGAGTVLGGGGHGSAPFSTRSPPMRPTTRTILGFVRDAFVAQREFVAAPRPGLRCSTTRSR